MSWRVGSTWFVVSLAAASLTLAAVRSPSRVRDGDHDTNPPPGPPPQLDKELVVTLYRVGLRADQLAAAGVASTVADDIVDAAETYFDAHPAALDEADVRLGTARGNHDRLTRLVRSGLASQDDVTACQAAIAEYEAAKTARKEALDAVFNAGTASVSANTKTLLARIKANEDAWGLPLQYLVVERSEADWIHLRDALANERVAAKRNESPDADEQAFLSTVRADSAVSSAKTSLDTTLAAVKSAWETAAAAE